MELSYQQTNNLLKTQFPKIELSYETISHKKVPDNYNVGLAIPAGKKYFIWFTFHKNKNVCYLMELNKEKKIGTVIKLNQCFHHSCSLGTVLYGTLVPANQIAETDSYDAPVQMHHKHQFFVIEDMFYYKGINTKEMVYAEKLQFINEFCDKLVVSKFQPDDLSQETALKNINVTFALPGIWHAEKNIDEFTPETLLNDLAYQVHHIQYRDLNTISPYLNISQIKKSQAKIECPMPKHLFMKPTVNPGDWNKPQYKYPTVFLVGADIQYDIYHLYTWNVAGVGGGGGENAKYAYYNVAYIPDYKTSVFMNGIFRKIRANQNLDYIEESEDEDGGAPQPDKTVDLLKRVKIECTFHQKFKKWVPRRIVGERERVVQNIKV